MRLKPLLLCATLALSGLLGSAAAGAADSKPAKPSAWGVREVLSGDATLPRVLLIGDSILSGYHGRAAELLRGKVNLDVWITPKHIGSGDLPSDMQKIFAQHTYDVILFNDIGLHAWSPGRIPEGQYEPLLRAHVANLRKFAPQARLIFASTTPMTTKTRPIAPDPEFNALIVQRNQMAARVMADNHIPVADYYAILAPRLELAAGDRFHWTRPAYELLAQCAAAHITQALATLPARPASHGNSDNAAPAQGFACDGLGYVRHWAVAGPKQTPYAGRGGSGQQMRDAALEAKVIAPPAAAALGSASPLNEPWRFYAPGQNIFVECTSFYHKLTVLDYYALTEIHAPREMTLPARLWAAGRADLWLNETPVARLDVQRGHHVESTAVGLPLHRGANRVCVRLQALGARDTRMLFGLQVLEGGRDLAVQISGPAAQTAQLAAAERWLQGVKPDGADALLAAEPAPREMVIRVAFTGKPPAWRAGQSRVSLGGARPFQVTLTLAVAGQKLERLLEIPANQPPPLHAAAASLDQHRRQYLEYMAAVGSPTRDVLQVLARRTLGPPSAADTPGILAALQGIESRKDCSDFNLAALLRLYAMGLVTPEEAAEIKRVALGFRYWYDEPGVDAMCFDSENHGLLFHGCQLLAGRLFPDETFGNSQRTAAQQAALGLRRCQEWLAKREKDGFVEYFSSTYIPLTVAAMINLVDLSGDAELSRRAAAQVDRVFADLATHAFDGVTVAPQGRVYRNVLYPQGSGTQALLSYATPDALLSYTNWVAFLASSKTYRPPAGLEALVRQPASKRSRHTDAEIVLYKTPAYLLTSIAIGGSHTTAKGAKPAGLQPGNPGYQQHLWHATLGHDCHVFVNHPGASFDQSQSRPGFWYGNGVLPRLAQRDGLLLEIFDVPESYPIGFTHAHWPADVFEHQEVGDHWAFGAKDRGCIALWCSQPLEPHDDVLSGRELRAAGRRAAWLCVCGDVQESGGLDGFKRSCAALHPALDAATRVLAVSGQEPLHWGAAK